MELPRKILIGEDVIPQVGSIVSSLSGAASRVVVITGRVVKARAGAIKLVAYSGRRFDGYRLQP